jgi:predicted DNA-binding transcriptional regulator AlpA
MEKRILRLPDVMKVTGLKRSSLYSAIQRNEFPKQVSLCVVPLAGTVRKWMPG